jgi:serine/threonine protein phosphatase PrpC
MHNLKACAAKSDKGPYLQSNEDLYDLDFELEYFALFDGFGGSGIGDVATKEFAITVKNNLKEIYKDKNATMPFFYSPRFLLEGNALINAINLASLKLWEQNNKRDLNKRAGLSGAFLIRSQSVLNIINCGNCRCYLIRNGQISKVYIEDSFQLLTQDNYQNYLKTIPLNALGLYPEILLHPTELRIFPRDIIILCTDGVYANLSDNEFYQIAGNQNYSPKEKIEEFFRISNDKGNQDNQSVIYLEF